MVRFDISKQDRKIIKEITKKAVRMAKKQGHSIPFLDLDMDITACHANGNPLKLLELLGADDFDFAHDVFGIMRHIDRTTGKLGDFFVPRYTKTKRKAA